MATYRVYQLDDQRRIKAGHWITAENPADARTQAVRFCEKGVDAIEIWQAELKIDALDCPPDSADLKPERMA